MSNPPKISKITGPPGCGKSTYLKKQIVRACDKFAPSRIGAVTFTNAGVEQIRAEIASTTGQSKEVAKNARTIHSHCFKLLKLNGDVIAERNVREFNALHPGFAIKIDKLKDQDEDSESWRENRHAEKLFSEMQVNRNRMIPEEQWMPDVQAIWDAWSAWMAEAGYVDFTGMLERTLALRLRPDIDVLFVDETQDLSPLQFELMKMWSKKCVSTVYAGDPDQCQPGWSRVLTTKGYKQMQHLDPKVDRLVVYDRRGAQVYTGSKKGGVTFEIVSRPWGGVLFSIISNQREAFATQGHKWIARWADKATALNAVYLMRQGSRFRIGWCQLFNSEGTFHLGIRSRLEKADSAWILKITDSKTDASMWESYYSTYYGMPTITFEPINNSTHYTENCISKFFGMFDQKELLKRAYVLLGNLSLRMEYPFWSKKKSRGCNKIMELESCNLLPKLMSIPSYDTGRKVQWFPIKEINKKPFNCTVYSLNVKKYHTYMTEGLVTKNCIYRFAGTIPEAFTDLKHDWRHHLDQSYRVPHAVHAYAEQIIGLAKNREVTAYKPVSSGMDTYKGEGRVYRCFSPDLTLPGMHMILCRCKFQVPRWIDILMKNNYLWHNPYRPEDLSWNPTRTISWIAARTYYDLMRGKIVKGKRFKKMVEKIQGGFLVRGTKTRIKDMENDENIDLFNLANLGFNNDFIDAIRPVSEVIKLTQRVTSILRKTSTIEEAEKMLMQEPKVIIGTIHSVKGGEADHVWLDTSLSPLIYREIRNSNEAFYDECRVAYVAATRAKQTLGLVSTRDWSPVLPQEI